MEAIKNVVDKIYSFDFSKASLLDGYEIISEEFTNAFSYRDVEKGYSIIPFGYTKGLFYKASEEAIFNSPKYLPEIVDFNIALSGLKKGHFYRITVTGRNSRKYSMFSDDVTDNRSIVLRNAYKEILINKDFSEDMEYVDVSTIFKAENVEDKFSVQIGKIYLRNICLEEIEMLQQKTEEVEESPVSTYEPGKEQMVAYGLFSMGIPEGASRRREVKKLSGKGISIFYDSVENVYTLERDNDNDTICDNLANGNIIVDFNINKMNAQNVFSHYTVLEVSSEISPCTMKPGYIKFRFMENERQATVNDPNSKLFIRVSKLY